MSTKKRSPLPVIFFTLLLDSLGVGILIPVIPQLLANPASQYYLLTNGVTLQQGYIMLGFLTAIFPFMQFLATPILGELSDQYGRKKVLALSLFGTAISYVAFAIGIITRNLPLLFASRAFDGITGGNISVAQASIADVTTPENRAKNFGMIGAAFGLGFIIGPYIGGKLSDPNVVSWFNATTPFWFAAILSFANVLSVIFYMPETLQKMRTGSIHWAKSIHNIFKAFSYPDLRAIFVSVFLYMGGFTFFTTFFGVFLINRFHFNQGNIGDFFAYVGLWIVITQAVITRRLSGKFSGAQILRFSMLGTGVFILAYFFPTHWFELLLITPFFAICNGLTMANTTALVSRSAQASHQGEVLGINSSVQALAQAIPPILSGYIAAHLAPEASLVVSGVVIFCSWIVFVTMYKQPGKSHR